MDRQKSEETRLRIQQKLQECRAAIHRSEEEERASHRVTTAEASEP